MEFKKYNSIENSYRTSYIKKVIYSGLNDGEWCVTEKVDGANYSFSYDGQELKHARRSDFISELESFMGSVEVNKKYDDMIKRIYSILIDLKYKFESFTVYGEIFGGIYRHEDVSPVNNAKVVQHRINYCPHNDFYAYDLTIDDCYIPRDQAYKIFESVGLIYAKPLFIGTFDKCLKYKNDYQTTIPSIFNLPEIENNITEGNVIAPWNNVKYFKDERVIIKNKNKLFSEKMKTKHKTTKEVKQLSENGLSVYHELLSYLNESRVSSVVSKIGIISTKDFGKIMKLVRADMFEEFMKDNCESWNGLNGSDINLINKLLSGEISKVIRIDWLNILDSHN